MSKRLGVRVALAIAALSAMTLLQGCADEDAIVFGAAWAPVGSMPIPEFFPGFNPGAAGSTSGGMVVTGTF